MSPATSYERKQRQHQWEKESASVVPDWEAEIQDRRMRAVEGAARNHREFMMRPVPPAPPEVPREDDPNYNLNEHGNFAPAVL